MTTNPNKILRPLGVAAVVAMLCFAASPLRAQQAPAPQQAPSAAAPTSAAPPAPATPEQQPVAVIKKESKLVLVDAVVTDKKGNYVHDLTQNDFKVYQDNKEQQVASFSTGADVAVQANNAQKHYLILFFDNSSMAIPDQIQARGAATKFMEANAGPVHLMAVVNFGGALRIAQNFTANPDALRSAISGVKSAYVASNATADSAGAGTIASPGFSSISSAETDFGARTMLLAVRSLAKNLRSVPGRKMLVLFSSGFALTTQNQSELTATIDACNKANVAIYSLDVRGLVAPSPTPAGGSARRGISDGHARAVSQRSAAGRPRLVLTSSTASPVPQRPGGGNGGAPGTGTGGKGGTPGTAGNPGGTRSNTPTNYNPYNNYANNPYNQSRSIVPQFPDSVSTNQQVLAALAEGTGGFSIFNTNDLLGGLGRIGKEQNEFYILGYVPADSPEGSCHTLKVKLNRGGMNVRSRTGFCNARTENPLEGKPAEKQLELRAAGTQAGSIHGALEAPYFYTG